MPKKQIRTDYAITHLIAREEHRQRETLDLIPSENWASLAVRMPLASVLGHKYSEGYPGARYYPGNAVIDDVERLCQTRALEAFGLSARTWEVNVQAHSGSPANLAVYSALVPPGGRIMGLALDMGGHLTHAQPVSFTGKVWRQVPYGVDRKTERIDYDVLLQLAKKQKPHLIVAGATAYPRTLNFKAFRRIADSVGAHLLADISHIAGLIAGRRHPSPFPYADAVTTTTHKTIRGPRGALIFFRRQTRHPISKNVFFFDAKDPRHPAINKAIIPGLQGGPHQHQTASIATALWEMQHASFRRYAKLVVADASALASSLRARGWRIVSGGTSTHLLLMDVWKEGKGLTGREAQDRLETVGIIANRNTIPFDARSPFNPSGLRMGSPTLATRGMGTREMVKVADLIDAALRGTQSVRAISREVKKLCRAFPLPL